jgi:activator of 2-hydroxyglutaryl-CoA dehydratase
MKKNEVVMGIDVGSVSVKVAILNSKYKIL